MNIRVKKVTFETIKHFPYRERTQAMQAIYNEVVDKTGIALESALMASIKYLIEHGHEDEVEAYIAYMQDVLDTSAEWYEDGVAEGLRNQLHELGYDFNRR